MTELHGVHLMAGWTYEVLDGDGWVTIRCPEGGAVTVDFNKRGFRGGVSTHGRMVSTATYAGRGWKQALVANAVRWLDNVRY